MYPRRINQKKTNNKYNIACCRDKLYKIKKNQHKKILARKIRTREKWHQMEESEGERATAS
jgi:hypothetical protein